MFRIKRLDLLISLYIGFVCVSELMGAKTFPITIVGLHLNATVAIFVLPFVYAINDIITEVYGQARARSVVWSGLAVIFMLLVFASLATSLPPSARSLPGESAYDAIFHSSMRISAASLIAFAVSDLLDVYIFAKLRQRLGKKNLWLRYNASNIVSEFVDTALFMTLAFYALNLSASANLAFIASIAIPYWLLRCCMSVIETPLVYAGVPWLRREA